MGGIEGCEEGFSPLSRRVCLENGEVSQGKKETQMCYSTAGEGSGKMGLTLTSRTFTSHRLPSNRPPRLIMSHRVSGRLCARSASSASCQAASVTVTSAAS